VTPPEAQPRLCTPGSRNEHRAAGRAQAGGRHQGADRRGRRERGAAGQDAGEERHRARGPGGDPGRMDVVGEPPPDGPEHGLWTRGQVDGERDDPAESDGVERGQLPGDRQPPGPGVDQYGREHGGGKPCRTRRPEAGAVTPSASRSPRSQDAPSDRQQCRIRSSPGPWSARAPRSNPCASPASDPQPAGARGVPDAAARRGGQISRAAPTSLLTQDQVPDVPVQLASTWPNLTRCGWSPTETDAIFCPVAKSIAVTWSAPLSETMQSLPSPLTVAQ